MDHDLRQIYFQELEKEIRTLIDPVTGKLSKDYSRIIPCPLCGADYGSHAKLFIKNGYAFVRCNECGMIFTNPQVNMELVNSLYGESKSNDIWVEIQESSKEQQWKREYYENSINLLTQCCFLDTVKLLDIGCSTGYFLEILKQTLPEWKFEGIELNRKAVEYARTKGLSVHDILLSELDPSNVYDIFTLFGVLEHLTDPQSILEDIKLRAGCKGCLVMAIVPNAYSLYHMFLQQQSVSFDGRNHLLYFSADTLSRLFIDSGFQIVHLDTVLTGLENIKRQMQWFNPNENISTDRYIAGELRTLLNSGKVEECIYKFNLGLRLRIIAKYVS